MAERIPPSGRGDFAEFYVIQTRWQDNDAYDVELVDYHD